MIGQIPRGEMIGGSKGAQWGDRGASGFRDCDEDFSGLRAVAFLNLDLHVNDDGDGGQRDGDTGFGPGIGVEQLLELW